MAVQFEQIGDVAVVTLDNPPHNFIDADTATAVVGALVEAETTCRSAVIAANGRSFCAGANFGSGGLLGGETRGEDGFRAGVGAFYKEAAKIFDIGIPLVAAVHGPAVGAGVGLALACDFRVSTAETFFATNFVRLGIHPGFAITLTLPMLIGPARASDMLLTGRRVRGEEAREMGLVDRLAGQDTVFTEAIDLASKIAAAAPLAVTATRATLRAGLADRVREVLAHELEEQARLAGTADSAEGIAAMLAKREPKFTGA